MICILKKIKRLIVCLLKIFFAVNKRTHACSVAQSCLTLCDPMDWVHQAPLFMAFSRQEYWSGLLFPIPGDLPDPGMELVSLMAPA